MGVKLWTRKFDQQNLNRSPPGNGGYAGVQPAFKFCAPMRTCSQEESPQITAVLWCVEPRRRNAPTSVAQWYPNTKKAACKLQTAEPLGRTDIDRRLNGIPINNGSVVVQDGGVEFPDVAGRNDARQHAVVYVRQGTHHVDDRFN